MINKRISEFNPGNDRVPVMDGKISRQAGQSELEEMGNQLNLATGWATRKNGLAIVLIVIAALLPAVLDHWTTTLRSTHGAGGSQSQMPVLVPNEEKQSSNPEFTARDLVDQGTPKEPSRRGNLTPVKAPASGIALGLKAKTPKQDAMRNDPSDRGVNPEESTFENTNTSQETKSTELSEGILERPSSGRETTHGQPEPGFVWPIIHQHTFGSCRGELKLNSGSITFLPMEGVMHGFDLRLSDITDFELGNTLKIKTTNKIYRFKATLASSREDNRARLNAIYLQLMKFRAGVQ